VHNLKMQLSEKQAEVSEMVQLFSQMNSQLQGIEESVASSQEETASSLAELKREKRQSGFLAELAKARRL